MASLELRNKTYRVVFMHGGRRHGYSLDTADRRTAEALKGGVEKTLMLLGQGVLVLPVDVDVVTFVRSGGTAARPSEAAMPAAVITFASLRDRYLDAQSHGAIEANTLATARMHLTHVGGTLGDKFPVGRLTLADVQRHVDRRLRSKYRGRLIGPLTVRKEVSTFRAAWNWAAVRDVVTGPFPSRGLVYPKTDEKPPFATLQDVERRVAAGGLTDAERDALYESLFLCRDEVDALLAHVSANAAHPFVHPMICTAAHTGARRSELLRMEVADVDLAVGTLLVREKKRSKKQRTTRRVSLTPFLTGVLRHWLAAHPGGRFLFCQAGTVARSRKRSATTGHQSGQGRATSLAGRRATVRGRQLPGVTPLTKEEAHDHLKRTLAGSRWEDLRGFHVLRHSFISRLAAAGVDQRIIDEFVGHQTDEQRRRYRHLLPDLKRKAIAGAFGPGQPARGSSPSRRNRSSSS